MDNALFNTAIKFNDYAKRNIVFVSKPRHAFASISDDGDIRAILAASNLARKSLSRKNGLEDFYYTAAIGYPFQTRPFMETRYSDGTYPVWYGSKTLETSIYETAHHTLKFLLAEEGILAEKKIVRERTVFDVFCNTFLIDITQKINDYPEIISNNYDFTNQIGKEVRQSRLPGILSPSARHPGGVNISVFTLSVLQDPKKLMNLQYNIFPRSGLVEIVGLENKMEIAF